jgi:hypothetical protein
MTVEPGELRAVIGPQVKALLGRNCAVAQL